MAKRTKLKKSPTPEPEPEVVKLAKTKLTRKLIKEFCDLIRAGLPPDGVCDYIGISSSTFWTWKRKGERYITGGEQEKELFIYGLFLTRFKKSFASWRLERVLAAQNGSKFTWVRDVTLLERRDRTSFGKTERSGGADEKYEPDEKFI